MKKFAFVFALLLVATTAAPFASADMKPDPVDFNCKTMPWGYEC